VQSKSDEAMANKALRLRAQVETKELKPAFPLLNTVSITR